MTKYYFYPTLIKWPNEKRHTIKWPREKGQTIKWQSENDRK
jgi:hypothetical protein